MRQIKLYGGTMEQKQLTQFTFYDLYWDLIKQKAFQSDNVFKIQNGHRWIINYDQLEREVYKIVGATPKKE